MFCKHANVIASVAQRRNINLDHRKAIKQIRPEMTRFAFAL